MYAKKVFCVVGVVLFVLGGFHGLCFAGESDFQGPNSFKYDASKYKKYVARSNRVDVVCNYYLTNSGIGYKSKLGYSIIRTYTLVPYQKEKDGLYHSIVVYECEMNPVIVNSTRSIRSVAEYAQVGIRTPEPNTRVMIPVSSMVSTSNSATLTSKTNVSGGIKFDSRGKAITASGTYDNQASTTFSYQQNGLSLSNYKNLDGRATWAYNYIPRGDVYVDQWVASTSYTTGMVTYETSTNGSMTGQGISFYVDIRFGAQYFSGSDSGKRIWDLGTFSKNYDLGRISKNITFYY